MRCAECCHQHFHAMHLQAVLLEADHAENHLRSIAADAGGAGLVTRHWYVAAHANISPHSQDLPIEDDPCNAGLLSSWLCRPCIKISMSFTTNPMTMTHINLHLEVHIPSASSNPAQFEGFGKAVHAIMVFCTICRGDIGCCGNECTT